MSFADVVAAHAATLRREHKSLILLWMNGGPSQFDTFSPKQGSEGGTTGAISTAVPGIEFSARLPQLAKVADDLCVVRSLTNEEGNHRRAAYQMHTGYAPSGSVKHPSFVSSAAGQLSEFAADGELPTFVSIGPTQGAGFLGPALEPFVVTNPGQLPPNVGPSVSKYRLGGRLELLSRLEAVRPAATTEDHAELYEQATDLVLSRDVETFDTSREPETVRWEYGNTDFGRGCLLARRLVERGVSCVEVRSDGWDTHDNADERLTRLTGTVDPAAAALLGDLKRRGLLESTLVVWMGEFGRTPRINGRGGRDHFPAAFNAALAGCGIRGGQVIGRTDATGSAIVDRPVTAADLLRTVSHALGVDADHEHISPLGRPLKVVDGGEVVSEAFG